MFWGLIMEPRKRYTQNVKKGFHVSMASLDIENSDDEPCQILCGYEGKNYLLCTLQKPHTLQVPLDYCFEEGTNVSFATNGKSHVHLTGYLMNEEFGEADGDDEEDEFEVQNQKKGRPIEDAEETTSSKKRKKTEKLVQEEEEVDEEEEDDSDIDMEKLLQASDVSEEETEDLSEEELEDEEADTSDEDDDEEEEKVPQVNGLGQKKIPEESTPKQKGGKNIARQQTPGPKATKSAEKAAKVEKQPKKEKKQVLSGGLIVEDLKEGNGDVATNGKFLHVYYEGKLKSNNKVFDKTLNGPGFGFRLGKSEVIKGWDIGLAGMKVGGKRRITCPPQLGYGKKGSPPVIPPNATLVFEVELRKIK